MEYVQKLALLSTLQLLAITFPAKICYVCGMCWRHGGCLWNLKVSWLIVLYLFSQNGRFPFGDKTTWS